MDTILKHLINNMKKNDITNYLIDKKEKRKFSMVSLFINCIISIFSLCLSVDTFCFFHSLINDSILEKLLFVIMGGLILTFIATLRYSFFSFIKSLAEKYKLLLILGIKTTDFWRLAVKEYFFEVYLIGIKVIFISNIICSAISYIIFSDNFNINLRMVIKQFLVTIVLVFLLYVMILTFTMIGIMYNRRKKSLIDFFERFSQDLSKGYKNVYGYIWKPITGIVFLIISFALLINFRVEKMILAIFLNIIGAFLFIRSNGHLIKKIIKNFKSVYYKKILIWTDLIYQYKINSYLIFILYTLNFFLVYFMGGLIVSVYSGDDYIIKYPYETIIYSDRDICTLDSYHVLLFDVLGYGSVTGISNNDYNHLMKTKYKLREGDVLFLDEREKETDSPLIDKKINIISKGQDYKYLTYNVKDAEWKVIFGQNIFPELNGVVVFNDKDFNLLLQCEVGENKSIFLSNQVVNRDESKLLAETKYWNRTQQEEKEHIENKVVITLIYMISLILILEGQAFIFTKQIVNLKKESYHYDILKQLGIKKVDLEKIIEEKIKGILMIPSILAIMSGLIFFAMDIYQEPNEFKFSILMNYGIVILIFAFLQNLGCYLISRKIKKIYINGY